MNDDLYAALMAERFGPIPWHECYLRPTPLVRPRVAGPDTPRAVAARQRELCEALDGAIGKAAGNDG